MNKNTILNDLSNLDSTDYKVFEGIRLILEAMKEAENDDNDIILQHDNLTIRISEESIQISERNSGCRRYIDFV